jgi:sulfotransferase family protein
LTWSIGQHPNILALEETGWMGPVAQAAAVAHSTGSARGERSQLSAMGVTREELLSAFGGAINDIVIGHRLRYEELAKEAAIRANAPASKGAIGAIPTASSDPVPPTSHFPNNGVGGIQISRGSDEPKQRWVDGTPENSFYIYELSLLFPGARFIHIVRDPRAVARSLVYFHTIGGAHFTADAAYREWVRNVRDCYNAEIALGSERVLRVRYDELAKHGPTVIAFILDFIGESYVNECAAALEVRINASAVPAGAQSHEASPELKSEAEALAAAVLDTSARFKPDTSAQRDLETRFAKRSFGSGLSPTARQILRQCVPRDATVIVVTGGDSGLLELEGRVGLHFPQGSSGGHVAIATLSDLELVGVLDSLRMRGAEFLVVPAEHRASLIDRPGFTEHMSRSFAQIAKDNGIVEVWSLVDRKPAEPPEP